MLKYVKKTIITFLGIDTDLESILNNQEEIISSLKSIEKNELLENNAIMENKKENNNNFLTLKNLLWLLFLLGFIGGGFMLFNSGGFNNDLLESIKSLGDLHKINYQIILDTLSELNKNSLNVSKEEIKILLEIRNLLLKKGIAENKSSILDKPLNEIKATFTIGNPIPGVEE